MSRQLLVTLITVFVLIDCSNQSKRTQGEGAIDGDLPFNPRREPFDDETMGSLGNTLASGNGGLTTTDQSALQKLFSETNDVNTNDELARISSELAAELEKVRAEENRTGTIMAGRRIQLMSTAITDCMKRALDGAPKPGQTLQGRWQGNGCASSQKKSKKKGGSTSGPRIAIEVAGASSPNRYPVSGGTKGLMGARNDGVGIVSAQPWSGQLSDGNFTGLLNHPKYQKKSGIDYPCAMEVGMVASTNPIPENHVLAMKIVGKCYKQALFLASPAMDATFRKMDPALVQLLQNRMLGIR